jgi:hypothetical protein
MAKRKIVSQTNDATQAFPSLNFPISKVLTEAKIVDGVEYKAGQVDPTYVPEIEVVPLAPIDNKMYYSVHGDYTSTMLKPTAQNDYVIETGLDGNFTYTMMLYNVGINTKFQEDPTYLEWLGLPAYNPETDTVDLNTEVTVEKHLRDDADARWEAKVAEQVAHWEALGIDISTMIKDTKPAGPGTPPDLAELGKEGA